MGKFFFIFALCGLLSISFAQDSSFKFENESEAGLVLTSGNSDTQTYNFAQSDKFTFGDNLMSLKGKYLQQKSNGILSAKPWSVNFRYERSLTHKISLFFGQTLESDIFARYKQRYHSDLGGKYFFSNSEEMPWFVEVGYRFTRENRTSGDQLSMHYVRAYSEIMRKWNAAVSSKLWVEYLPNITTGSDYQINTEASTLAQVNSIISLKVAYLMRYDNLPAIGAKTKSDNTFTTSLVAKF